MGDRLFIYQAQLEAWIGEGKVTFVDNLLTILDKNASYELESAAEITGLLDGDDTASLLGKTYTISELQAQGVDYSQGCAILGDTAYQCAEGFVGILQGGDAQPAAAVPRVIEPTLASTPAGPEAGVPTVEPGAVPPVAARPEPFAPADSPASPGPKDDGERSDADLLTDFMLKHL